MSGLHLSLQETLKNKSVVRCTKGKKTKPQRLNLDFYERKSPPMLGQSMLRKRPHIIGTLGLEPTESVDLRFGFWTCIWWRTTKTGAVSGSDVTAGSPVGMTGDWREEAVVFVFWSSLITVSFTESQKRLTKNRRPPNRVCRFDFVTPRASPWQRVCYASDAAP